MTTKPHEKFQEVADDPYYTEVLKRELTRLNDKKYKLDSVGIPPDVEVSPEQLESLQANFTEEQKQLGNQPLDMSDEEEYRWLYRDSVTYGSLGKSLTDSSSPSDTATFVAKFGIEWLPAFKNRMK